MQYSSYFISSLLLLTATLFVACVEDDTLRPPECRLTYYGENYLNGKIRDYTFVLDYDNKGRVIKKTYYQPYSVYQRSAYYDSIGYEGNRVDAIYRKHSDSKVVLMFWDIEYKDQYEVVSYYLPLTSEPGPASREFVWRDSKNRITRVDSGQKVEDSYKYTITPDHYIYHYDDKNLIQRDYFYYKISNGDTIKSSYQIEKWSSFSEAKNPFKGLPFIELRHKAYSEQMPTQYYVESYTSDYPDLNNSKTTEETYTLNEYGYPDRYLYDCVE